MTTLHITIEVGGDAFQGDLRAELTEVLNQLLGRLDDDVPATQTTYPLRDSKGNRVGEAAFK